MSVRRVELLASLSVVVCCGSSTSNPDGGDTGLQACEAAVDSVKAACAAEDPQSPRLCQYDAIRSLCTTGHTAFVTEIFKCLLLDACQSPDDPSGGGSCVDSLIDNSATSADKDLGAVVCACGSNSALPGCGSDLPYVYLADSMLLSPSDVGTLTTCDEGSACSNTCFEQTALEPAIQCH